MIHQCETPYCQRDAVETVDDGYYCEFCAIEVRDDIEDNEGEEE